MKKYTLPELFDLILPMLQSMPKGDEVRVVKAILDLVAQDREARIHEA
jgi:hypothetical protein